MGPARQGSRRGRNRANRPDRSESPRAESPIPTHAAQQRNKKKLSRREKRRELYNAQEFPGLSASAEAIELEPGEGILDFSNAGQGEYFDSGSESDPHFGSWSEQDRSGSAGSEFSDSESEPSSLARNSRGFSPRNEDDAAVVPPWLNLNDKSQLVGHKLTNEVLSFLCYMSPTPNEVALRERCIARLRRTVTHLWPGCDIEVFGSYATGMYLPEADIDVAIVGDGMRAKVKSEMYKLSYKLRSSGMASNILVISHARVPIVKYVEAGSGLNVDIAFMQTGGIETAERVCSWLRSCEALKPLAMVVRHFLKRRNLGDVATGGLGGYATLCMVYSRLEQRFGTRSIDPLKNVGILLLDFFDYYGHKFDNNTQYVCPLERPDCYPRPKRENGSMGAPQAARLAIQDPSDDQNNISKASHNYPVIKRSFGNAADMLKGLCLEWHRASPRRRSRISFLAPLLRFAGGEAVRQKSTLEAALSIGRNGRVTPPSPPPPPQLRGGSGQQYKQTNRNEDIFPEIAARNNGRRRRGSDSSQSSQTSMAQGRQKNGRGRHSPGRAMEGFSNGSNYRPIESGGGACGAAKNGGFQGESNQSSNQQPKRRRSSGDDSDSRTKSTTAQRRQFWSRKAGVPETNGTLD